MSKRTTSRRRLLQGAASAGFVAASPLAARFAQAQSSEPIRIGFQQHSTGIGAAYGRWYGRTTEAAAKAINDAGGINGRPLEIIAEDDGTDPKRGAEVIEKFANQHGCDVAFGTLFSHVVFGSAPAAGEVKIPYYVVSEGHHVASGALNRYTLQPGITDVKSQVQAMAPYVAKNLGKKVHHDLPRLRLRPRPPATISQPPSRPRAARCWNISPSLRPKPRLPNTSRKSPARPRSCTTSWSAPLC